MNTSTPANKIYGRIVIFFLILTVAAIFLVLHFALAKATITIDGYQQDREANVLVELKPEGSEVSAESIFGKILTTEVEPAVSVAVNATTQAGSKAAGQVTIINNYSKDQALVKTTRLLTADNKLFRISESVLVPAGGQVNVWAQADQAGDEFLIAPSKFTIPGLWEGLQDKIYAQSNETMKLQSSPSYAVGEADLKNAADKAKAEALAKSLQYFNSQTSNNLQLEEKNIFLQAGAITKSSGLGEAKEQVEFQQKFSAYGLVFNFDDLLKAAENKFANSLPGNEKLISLNKDNLTYTIAELNTDKGTAVINVHSTATVSGKQGNTDIDKTKLVGLTASQAAEYLKNELKIDSATIKLWPFWVTRIPKLQDHIIIE